MSEYDPLLGDGGVPTGFIGMWSGDPSELPEGWTLCDGTSPDDVDITVPNLQDRFIVGAGDQYDSGETGGEDQVQLSEDELASHDHGDGSLSASNHNHGSGSLSADSHSHNGDGLSASSDGAHRHRYLDNVRSGPKEDNFGDGETVGTEGWDILPSEETHQTGESGSHSHSISGETGTASPDVSGSTSYASPSVSGRTGSAGNNNAHENRPQYFAVAYIMKL